MGDEPDPRFSFANERTFLAWNRTGLALMGGGLVVHQFVTAGPAVRRTALAVLLIARGCAVAGAAYGHWRRFEAALRRGEPLPAQPAAGAAVARRCRRRHRYDDPHRPGRPGVIDARASGDAGAQRDPGVSVGRTTLAWQRTALAFAALAALLTRAGAKRRSVAGWSGAALLLVVTLVVSGAERCSSFARSAAATPIEQRAVTASAVAAASCLGGLAASPSCSAVDASRDLIDRARCCRCSSPCWP